MGYKQLDREKSAEIARQIGKGAKPITCWQNALYGLSHFPNEAVYCDGWVVSQQGELMLVIEHAWLEYEDRIIDPTLCDDDIIYCGRVTYTKDEVYAAMRQGRKLPLPMMGATY